MNRDSNNNVSQHEKLRQGAQTLGVPLSNDDYLKLLAFITLLHKWNKIYNLTAIRELHLMVSYHLLDSLAVLPYMRDGLWLDVGCGAGLPGIVLAIARPNSRFVLMDSNSKKTSFVQQAIIELDLSNVVVNCSRVEDWKTTNLFDGIISRAYSELSEFFHNTKHLLGPHGRWIAMKGVPYQELENISGDFEIERVIPLKVPGIHAARSLVIASSNWNEST